MSGNAGMESLIPVINQLQDAFAKLGKDSPLDLPQIAVVGGQSAGKSSVLENFVGRDFLPRGSGIVTRRPLVLQLNNYKGREYGEFLHTGNRKFTDFAAIRKEIEDETDRETGHNKGISSYPINLRIFSPHVLNLTLIDLPGLTKVAVGDQPHDIEDQIRAMIMEFITKENCLILAVSPANSDLANSDALKLAKEVDPQGLRTIGVLTKLDLMDDGTDARTILENKLLPLRRGYVGVVNRSQKDIEGRKDISAAMAAEKSFFTSHPAYRHIANKMGTPKLQEVLNQQLTNHIRETIPELKKQLDTQIAFLEKETKGYDNSSRGKPNAQMMQMIQRFSTDYWNEINGTGAGDSVNVDSLSGGAKINQIFHERFPYELTKYEYDERELRKEISILILNVKGIRSGLFTPDEAFYKMCEKQIHRFRLPSLECSEITMNELVEVVRNGSEKLAKYPRLREEAEACVIRTIKEAHTKCNEQLEFIINCHLSYINTNHPEFVGYQSDQKGDKNEGKQKQVQNQVIRRGYLSAPLGIGGSNKEFWFVLSAETLAWYKTDDEMEQKYLLKLDGLRCRDVKGGFMSRSKHVMEIYKPDSKFIFKEYKSLTLTAATQDELDGWKASFLRAGVFPDRGVAKKNSKDESGGTQNSGTSFDPVMERKVETIRNMVGSYVQIVATTIKDIVPKTIMCFLIEAIKEELDMLFAEVTNNYTVEQLMEESSDEKQRREDMLEMLAMAKNANKMLSNIKTNAKYEPPPPEVNTPPVRSERPSPRPTPGSKPPIGNRPNTGDRAPPSPATRPVPGGRPTPGTRPTPGGGGGAPNIPSRPGGGGGAAPPSIPRRPR